MEFFKENHANLSDEKSSPAPDLIELGGDSARRVLLVEV